jgi:tetratricopeptide (TPR) repeat protein
LAIDASEERLSKYELIRPLGSGGMGEVYLARDRVLQRLVAIKFVSSKLLHEPGAERRLVREARAAAALDHPAICPVYDVVEAGDRTCIVMQYVDGETLAALLNRGPLEPAEAVTLALRIAEALAVAHAASVVHRDLKPQNIMLMRDGRPKLLDFGIAQTQLPPDVVASIETHTATETVRSGAVVGTPAYTSPEQVLQKPVDGRSDLFSLGAVLYECLTGQPAFLASTDVETWARVVYFEPPVPSTINRAVTPAMDALVAKLLAKDPDQRYGSAEAAAAGLRALGGRGTDLGMSRRQLALAAAAVVIAIAVTVITAWRLTRPRPLPPAPPDAARWYSLGTEQLRDGSYASAERAFTEALKLYSDYPLALARLAEAQVALQEEREAAASVLRISTIVPDLSRVAGSDGVRLAAVRALVIPDLPRAIAEYQKIADSNPADRGAWLDLADVQYRADRRASALETCDRALRVDPQYPAARLRRALIAADLRRRDQALKEFDEAERLYRAASNVEGQTEVLLGRARLLNGIGDVNQARSVVDAAAALAQQTGNRFQQVRAALLKSNITVSLGDFDTARRMAAGAVDAARQNDFDTVAADGLVDLATALMFSTDYNGAEAELIHAIELARRREAKGVVVRGTLQLASLYLITYKPRDAIALADGMLGYIRFAQYKSHELKALSVLMRAKEMIGEYGEAQRLGRETLAESESLKDDATRGVALESLAGSAAGLGMLPEALTLRIQLEELYVSGKQNVLLAFNLANRAELLVRLGRFDEANGPLGRIDSGAAAHASGFTGRARRATVLRALAAIERRDFREAEGYCHQVLAASPNAQDSTRDMAVTLLANAFAQRRNPEPPAPPAIDSGALSQVRELKYWRATALVGRGDVAEALRVAQSALADMNTHPSDEYEWRMAALGAVAASRRGDPSAVALAARAQNALSRLRAAWKQDAMAYERRPDLTELKHAANIS